MAEPISMYISGTTDADRTYRLNEPGAVNDLRPYVTQEATLNGVAVVRMVGEERLVLMDPSGTVWEIPAAITAGLLVPGSVVARWSKESHT